MTRPRDTFKEHPVYTLTEISQSLRSVIAKNYPQPYYIKAEIVKLNYYPHSGHCYPELAEKEGNSIKTQMRAIIWASAFREINHRFRQITGEPLKEGINILCLATIEYDVKYGLSLHIQNVEPTYTLGDMVKNKLQVIERLKKEGLFHRNKERPWAMLPQRIAVISVETSKGYADFRVTLDNNPYHYRFQCTLFPSILQGDKAIRTIVEKLDEIEKQMDRFDSVVIIRGGGGDVGLSCYDDYRLAARVAAFPLPVIAGIGHSTNESVTDMVAYQSKITPTDVANFFIDKFRDLDRRLEENRQTLSQSISRRIQLERNLLIQHELNIDNLSLRVIHQHARALQTIANALSLKGHKTLGHHQWELDGLSRQFRVSALERVPLERKQLGAFAETLRREAGKQLETEQERLFQLEEKTVLLSPESILKRGFSITYFQGKALTNSNHISQGSLLVTRLYRGAIQSRVEGQSEDESPNPIIKQE